MYIDTFYSISLFDFACNFFKFFEIGDAIHATFCLFINIINNLFIIFRSARLD